MARRKAQTYGVRNLADCGGRLSARHMRIYWGALPRFALLERMAQLPRTPSACSFAVLVGGGPRFIPDQVEIGDSKPAPGRVS